MIEIIVDNELASVSLTSIKSNHMLLYKTTLTPHLVLFSWESLKSELCREGQAEAVRLLLSCGAEVDREDTRGRTPLFLSVSGHYLEAARSLLEAGAGLDKEDQERGKLHLATGQKTRCIEPSS